MRFLQQVGENPDQVIGYLVSAVVAQMLEIDNLDDRHAAMQSRFFRHRLLQLVEQVAPVAEIGQLVAVQQLLVTLQGFLLVVEYALDLGHHQVHRLDHGPELDRGGQPLLLHELDTMDCLGLLLDPLQGL